jgi:hypothetical protein
MMPSRLAFSATEREKFGVLVNNISVFAAEVLDRTQPALQARALTNLAKLKNGNEDLLRRLDEFARAQGEQSPLRLIEDLPSMPCDLAQILSLVRRCLLVSAFLGHCIAQPARPEIASEAFGEETRFH